ncbi:hypothetical protein CSOJ01_13055 [Colletotrichum sojae]|uniref:Uncharacterized protein n=1 Tax=Colletotrichum sojae TaxID=2175907 RepID=A0A8H6IU12_9PEZI|nr:hypothetical protein CSOJ01_13055 [Colletotrichum sojae]
MKIQILSAAAFLAAQAMAACAAGQKELWDLHILDGTAKCSQFGCYRACNSGLSCNGCPSPQNGPNVRTLGASYCCQAPLTGLSNTCVSRCPNE